MGGSNELKKYPSFLFFSIHLLFVFCHEHAELRKRGTLDPLPDFGEGKEGITRSVTHHRRAMDDNAQR